MSCIRLVLIDCLIPSPVLCCVNVEICYTLKKKTFFQSAFKFGVTWIHMDVFKHNTDFFVFTV